MSSNESALVVLVPEAEAVVKPFRDQYDPSAAAGMPAHITLLYPFKTPDEIDQMTLDGLRDCFARFEPIPFSLGTIQRFPNEVLYLAPEPNESFRQLTGFVEVDETAVGGKDSNRHIKNKKGGHGRGANEKTDQFVPW